MTTSLRYDRPLLKQAVANYIKRIYLKRMVWMTIAIIALVIFAFTCTDSPWLQAFTIVPAVFLPAMLAVGYVVRIIQSLQRLNLLDDGRVTVTATDASFNIESAIGKSEMNWKLFSELWEFPEMYLLLYNNNQFITLPKDQVQFVLIDFIRGKLPSPAKS